MIRKPCAHSVILPRGMRCNNGYLEILLTHKKELVFKSCGVHTKERQTLAEKDLAEIREAILLRRFNRPQTLKSKLFPDVSRIWFTKWSKELDENGQLKHNEEAIYQTGVKLNVLNEFFKDRKFDEIKVADIRDFQETRNIKGTTLNRYLNLLSSIYNAIPKWIRSEEVRPAFKVPAINPCADVDRAPMVKRNRVLSHYEASKLRNAFETLGDFDGWRICKMALKSMLSTKDLKALDIGDEINIERAKTGVPVNIPLQVLEKLNFVNWPVRWYAARDKAGLHDVQFRDLRKTGINWLKGKFDLKLISEYAGHADIKTTERSYTIKQAEYLEPLAKDLEAQVESI